MGSRIMPETKRAAVIGAGISGLEALRNLKEEGFEPTCFEKTAYLGGLWKYHEVDEDGVASVMKITIINTSKEMSAFSDNPPPAEYPNFMHNSLMYKYILSAWKKMDAEKYVKFQHETEKIEKTEDYEETGKWKVTCRNTQTGETVSDVFDCVAICIGHHVYPNIPTFPGQEKFAGKIMHSHSLKKAQGFEDLNIVVVGAGNSALDAACELSSVAKQVYLSSRRGTWVFPKVGPGGVPVDILTLRRIFFWGQKYLPYNLVCTLSEKILNTILDHSLYNLKPKHRILSQHPTVSDTLPSKLLSGVVVIRGNIQTFTKNCVIFDGEEKETPVDVVILATGYEVKFPFLSQDILSVKDNRVKLYKYIFPPDLPHPTLAIIGQVQPNGAGIPIAEMQCRWASRVMSRKLALPSKEQMHQSIMKKDEFNKERFTESPRHTFEVDFMDYQNELAEEIGVKPNLLKLVFTDPKLLSALVFGPYLSYQYRLEGPGAWAGARDAILTYSARMKAPLRRPGQNLENKEKSNFSLSRVVKLLLIVTIVSYFSFLLYSIVQFFK